MDASRDKDHVLVLLFVQYVSDKYADQPGAPIEAKVFCLSSLLGSDHTLLA